MPVHPPLSAAVASRGGGVGGAAAVPRPIPPSPSAPPSVPGPASSAAVVPPSAMMTGHMPGGTAAAASAIQRQRRGGGGVGHQQQHRRQRKNHQRLPARGGSFGHGTGASAAAVVTATSSTTSSSSAARSASSPASPAPSPSSSSSSPPTLAPQPVGYDPRFDADSAFAYAVPPGYLGRDDEGNGEGGPYVQGQGQGQQQRPVGNGRFSAASAAAASRAVIGDHSVGVGGGPLEGAGSSSFSNGDDDAVVVDATSTMMSSASRLTVASCRCPHLDAIFPRILSSALMRRRGGGGGIGIGGTLALHGMHLSAVPSGGGRGGRAAAGGGADSRWLYEEEARAVTLACLTEVGSYLPLPPQPEPPRPLPGDGDGDDGGAAATGTGGVVSSSSSAAAASGGIHAPPHAGVAGGGGGGSGSGGPVVPAASARPLLVMPGTPTKQPRPSPRGPSAASSSTAVVVGGEGGRARSTRATPPPSPPFVACEENENETETDPKGGGVGGGGQRGEGGGGEENETKFLLPEGRYRRHRLAESAVDGEVGRVVSGDRTKTTRTTTGVDGDEGDGARPGGAGGAGASGAPPPAMPSLASLAASFASKRGGGGGAAAAGGLPPVSSSAADPTGTGTSTSGGEVGSKRTRGTGFGDDDDDGHDRAAGEDEAAAAVAAAAAEAVTVATMASVRGEEYLERVRRSRESYWTWWRRSSSAEDDDEAGDRHHRRHREVHLRCGWCDDGGGGGARRGGGGASSSPTTFPADGDEMMQCLDCGVVGCGPRSTSSSVLLGGRRGKGKKRFKRGGRQHLIRHFVATGHSLGITCGPRADLFCMRCGDFVYHELFDREKLRSEVTNRVPWLSWGDVGPLRRSFGPSEFLVVDSSSSSSIVTTTPTPSGTATATVEKSGGKLVPSNGAGGRATSDGVSVVWPGMVATYPMPHLSPALVVGGAHSVRRLRIFGGELDGSLSWGTEALRLGLYQLRRGGPHRWKIRTPVGMYNLGNTCFMSCVLQCLLHCEPLQSHFLRDVGHHHVTCEILRAAHRRSLVGRTDGPSPSTPSEGGGPSTPVPVPPPSPKCPASWGEYCLACEMDRLFLETYGSSVGIDAVQSLSELPSSPSSPIAGRPSLDGDPASYDGATSNHRAGTAEPRPKYSLAPGVRGTPLVPSRLLTAAWRCGGMDHLAGYEQRDAHEFLQGFLDIMAKHAGQNRRTAARLRRLDDVAAAARSEGRRGELEGIVGGNDDTEDDVVTSLFQGQLRSVLICEKCGCKRSQPEPFLNISLPISKERGEGSKVKIPSTMIGTRQSTLKAARMNLQMCLEQFTTPEALADPVHCHWCDEKTPTQKQLTFAKLPRVLCLHLKRFDARTNKKICDPVTFPVRGLDMGRHLPYWCEVVKGIQSMSEEIKDDAPSEAAPSPHVLYDLFGIINHTGSLHQGHYLAHVKVEEKWYHCNDAFVSDSGGLSEKETDGAYMLFYIRREK